MKNIKLILASFCLVFIGCDDDDDVAAADTCTTNALAYSEYLTNAFAGTATAADCETALNGLLEWCADGCETATDSTGVMCTEEFTASTAEDVTTECAGLHPTDG